MVEKKLEIALVKLKGCARKSLNFAVNTICEKWVRIVS